MHVISKLYKPLSIIVILALLITSTPMSPLAAAYVIVSAATLNAADDCAVRIMPLGDSITRGEDGSSDNTGYRRSLYLQLTSAGYTSVDFIGSQSDGTPTDFDKDHEGHDGWKAEWIRDNIISWLKAQDGPSNNKPVNIILLHIGTNDISQAGDNSATTRDEIGQILDNIDAYETNYNTTIMVFLARIINRTDNNDTETTALNELIQSLADTRIADGDDIIVVDMESALNYIDDMADSVHPNDTGYGKMANTWAPAVLDHLHTICAAEDPVVNGISLVSSSWFNYETDDLTCNFTLGGTATTSSTAWYVDDSPQMTLYMPFEGGAINGLLDLSGNSIYATDVGNPSWSASGGHDGNGAYVFDGDDYLDAGGVFPVSSSYTKMAWVNRAVGSTGDLNIISSDSQGGDSNPEHVFWISSTSGYKLAAGHGSNHEVVQDSVALAEGEWFHVVVTWDAATGNMELYKNGVLVDDGNTSMGVSQTEVHIGGFDGSYGWKGTIDNARIYPQALSADQIAVLYGSGIGDPKTISAAETSVGQEWQCKVTPFSDSEVSTMVVSNVLAINDSNHPRFGVTFPIIFNQSGN